MIHHFIRYVLILMCMNCIFSPEPLFARAVGIEEAGEKDERDGGIEPLAIGNFLLPTTQQPTPLYGFGQNIVDAKDLQVYASPNRLAGHNFSFTEILFYAIYGVTDFFSIYFAIPVATNRTIKSPNPFEDIIPITRAKITRQKTQTTMLRSDPTALIVDKSSGLEDMILQFEYAFYVEKTLTSEFQATVVGNMTFPTGSTKKFPLTGFGSPAFFLGATANYESLFWFVYGSAGGILTTKKNGLKFGSSFLYQAGVEGIIGTFPEKKWIFAWMFELFGIVTARDIVMNQRDLNSGGHILFAGPSLWMSSKHFELQVGVATPVYQKLNGVQNRFSYFFNTNIAWTFNLQ